MSGAGGVDDGSLRIVFCMDDKRTLRRQTVSDLQDMEAQGWLLSRRAAAGLHGVLLQGLPQCTNSVAGDRRESLH